ncbi:MAG: hypothetical protein JW763_02515 [candidate division Zixibacteria bacterium]|nr:hypothetical protein [candidate division Zixibacteria bacterium]
MNDNYDVRLVAYPHIREMLDGVPRRLWDVFLPESIGGLNELEANIIMMKRREKTREQIMAIQKLTGMPLRPNEPLEAVIAKARIKGRIHNAQLRRYKRGDADSDT